MPPRAAPGRGRGGPSRGAPNRAAPAPNTAPSLGDHISTIGVKRPNFGSTGTPVPIFVNSFVTTIPEGIIHHYDVISPSEKTLPARLNMTLITALQTKTAPEIFTPRAVYDGRKNLFAIRELPFGGAESKEFDVAYSESAVESSKGPKVYKIRLTKVAEINPEVLRRFIAGNQSHDNAVLTAITALNVVIRMEPTMKYPFNVRSFFTNRETKDIGSGLELWRGYFQSVRPASGQMLINVDISTGTMYKPGSLLNLCLSFINKQDPNALAPIRGFPDRERLRLQRFISGIRVLTSHPGPGGKVVKTPRIVKKLTAAAANKLTFTLREGGSMTVADYFRTTQNRPLKYPDVICVEVGSGALIPLELCEVPAGQIMRKQVPPEKTKDVLDFATKKPRDRLESIKKGLSVLEYGNSEYVRQFGMHVDVQSGPLKVQARVLPAPVLRYGAGSRQPSITPRNGAWNMVDKRFYKPVAVDRWVVVIYETERRFDRLAAGDMISGLINSCREVGKSKLPSPTVRWENGQGRISEQLKTAGAECVAKHKAPPTLIVVILPEGGNDIYTAVKHFGDVTMGVATQCMKSSKCFRAKPQYYANVCLKINVKLGGINTIPDPASVSVLTDPQFPTIVMGADVIHPAPGSDGRPSFTALVANVDSNSAKYIADSRVQASRQEMIEELQAMSKHVLSMYMRYRELQEKKGAGDSAPRRIIFYRDGVSEGQFKQVLDQELPRIRKACEELNIKPKITIIVVGKRHHVRFFPQNDRDADRSGNCPAGTVVDREISHPTEFDFYLQSHGGLLGTSRPAHYSVLYDENNFSADALQKLSFALCHVYARSTRSVSIPAPVYYADIVCSRAKNHYDPQGSIDLSEATSEAAKGNSSLDDYRRGFMPLHRTQSTLMYFSVRVFNFCGLAQHLPPPYLVMVKPVVCFVIYQKCCTHISISRGPAPLSAPLFY
ncbi:argonaute-like protein [Cyathus striatus]|nr:argonaute-like protein [Cyathus striatus]